MYENRYIKNGTTISVGDHKLLMTRNILVAGCGGLGGYVIEMLSRLGIGQLTVVDFDVFDETNLNRQLLCEERLLGRFKSKVAAERVQAINRDVHVIPVNKRISVENGENLLSGHHLVIDALDNVAGRFTLQSVCEKLSIPLIHGAISGCSGQVAAIFPGDRLFDRIYREKENTVLDSSQGNPSFSPAVIAGFQVSEAIKVLTGKGDIVRNKLLLIDMLASQFEMIDL